MKKLSGLHLIEKDLRRNKILSKDKKLSIFTLLVKVIISYNARILFWFRIASCKFKILSKFARIRLKGRYGIDIGPNLRIGPGFSVPHPFGIVMGGDVIMGEDVVIGQHVTLGGNLRKTRTINGEQRKMPIIGSRVFIAAGSVIEGPVVIGDDVIIGANSIITKDVPSNSIAYGANHLDERKIKFDPEGSYTVLQDDGQEGKNNYR